LQGLRGNEARFINHGCNPNLEVRKYQTLGDGMEEYEVGMWALRDISAGEEVSKGLMRRDARRGVIDETALLQLQL
jgi:SET domain-containing protein